MSEERTFIAVKPDGVQRGLVGVIIKRFEQRGNKLVAMKFVQPTEALSREHYIHLKDLPFYPRLIDFMKSNPVVAMVTFPFFADMKAIKAWEGLNVVKNGRLMLGETKPENSLPGTIRGDFCLQRGRTIIHASDSVESAQREIGLWFRPDEIMSYTSCAHNWINE